jgi:hypothetical protein
MKSVFSTEKTYAQHGLNPHSHQEVRVEHRKTYAQHGLSNCEFIVTLAKSVLRKKKHMLNTDLAQHGLAKSVLSMWCEY